MPDKLGLLRRVAALCFAVSLAACTKVGAGPDQASGGRHPWTHPGEVRIAFQTGFKTLNPLLAGSTSDAAAGRLMFDILVSVDETGTKQVPMLAAEVPTLENGGISKDGLTVTYKLRHNVKWHDGVPFTSKDVRFTWNAIMSPNNNVGSRTGYELVRSVDTPDDYTVVFHLKEKFSPFVNTVFGESDSPYAILPEHLLGKLPNINEIPFNSNPIGTGPFKFKEWARGDHVTLVANPDYYLGAPKVSRVVLRFIPDENTEVNLLRTHDIDWMFEASPSVYPALKALPDTRILLVSGNQYERIQINLKHPPLDDVRVRQAIAYAIDTKQLVDELTYGSAIPADQDLPPFMWAHATNITRYPHDLAKAKALMAAAGWTPGADGILQKNGKRLSLEFVTNTTNATRRKSVVLVQAMLRPLGIESNVKSYPGELLFATLGQGGIMQNGRYDLGWNGWVAGIDPDDSSMFMCSARPPNGNNDMFYCNQQMDAAQRDALTHYSIPERKAAYAKIEALATADEPMIYTWWPRQIQPVNPDLKNFKPNPVVETWNAYQWEI